MVGAVSKTDTFDLPTPAPVRTVAAITWSLAAVFGLFRGWRGRLGVLLGFLLVAGWWSTLRPKQNRDWQPQVAVLAYASREGDQITVYNIRNFEYRTATEFTPRYETRTYTLANLRELDLFINYWGSKWIAHPSLSFDFGPQGRLCFSIETRFARGGIFQDPSRPSRAGRRGAGTKRADFARAEARTRRRI